LFLLARLGTACPCVLDQRRRGSFRLEGGVAIDVAGLRDRHRATRGLVRVEEPLEAVEPTRGDACERGALLVVELRRARVDDLTDRTLGQAPERNELAAGADRLRDRAEVVRD